MVLYNTCRRKWFGPRPPRPIPILGWLARTVHPCARAAKALDDAGYRYELKRVGGFRASPWTWRTRDVDRAEVRRLSGTSEVPILALDSGEVISSSGAIVRWARDDGPRASA